MLHITTLKDVDYIHIVLSVERIVLTIGSLNPFTMILSILVKLSIYGTLIIFHTVRVIHLKNSLSKCK